MKLHKEWQDYSTDINTEENPVRGVRAIIENLIIKIQWLCHRFGRFMMFRISFAIIMSPAFAGLVYIIFTTLKNNHIRYIKGLKKIKLTRIDRMDRIFYKIPESA